MTEYEKYHLEGDCREIAMNAKTVAAPNGSQQLDVVHHRLVREHDVWAVCRLCGDVISTPSAGTFEKMTDGTISAVHRRCTNAP